MIGEFFMSCDKWRKSTIKTMELMRKSEKPKLIERKEILPNSFEEIEIPIAKIVNDNQPNIEKYYWQKENNSWIYINQMQEDSWMYREKLGWLWRFDGDRFLYSDYYGWLYNYLFNNKTFYYWYDKKQWFKPSEMPQREL